MKLVKITLHYNYDEKESDTDTTLKGKEEIVVVSRNGMTTSMTCLYPHIIKLVNSLLEYLR